MVVRDGIPRLLVASPDATVCGYCRHKLSLHSYRPLTASMTGGAWEHPVTAISCGICGQDDPIPDSVMCVVFSDEHIQPLE